MEELIGGKKRYVINPDWFKKLPAFSNEEIDRLNSETNPEKDWTPEDYAEIRDQLLRMGAFDF